MIKNIFYLISVSLTIWALSGCAEKQEPLSVGTHPDGWLNPQSEKFHGKVVLESVAEAGNCKSCHGPDYSGGTAKVSCSQSDCHVNYPHPEGWTSAASGQFHGQIIAADLEFNLEECKDCHGQDFRGQGLDKKNCYTSGCHQIFPHPENFASKESGNFHGKYIDEQLDGQTTACQPCHGSDYQGNGYAPKNCLACHNVFPHKEGFADQGSENFHGKLIAGELNYDLTSCQSCHGTDYKGNGSEDKNCYRCHSAYPHGENFVNPESPDFHGELVEKTLNGDLTSCQSCHGDDFSGAGVEDKNCYRCHAQFPHAEDFTNPASDNFHGKYLAQNLQWDLTSCQSCHGTDYQGKGNEAKNCTLCHTQPEGPEACNTCHGSSTSFAPPPDLNGNEETTFVTVGAHQHHLQESELAATSEMSCSTCHITPQKYSDAGHVNDGSPNAEVVFNAFASDSGRTSPHWDRDAATCNNVYCHGDFVFRKADSKNQFGYADSVIVGNNREMTWNSVDTGQADCGTCHGLPPTGHLSTTACSACHGRVVDSDNNIIDKTLHINGLVEVF